MICSRHTIPTIGTLSWSSDTGRYDAIIVPLMLEHMRLLGVSERVVGGYR
jgi:hypothetical protein